MEKNAAAGRTPGSFPVATPPPVSSPVLNSPKIALPSSLNTRLQSMRLDGQHQDTVDRMNGSNTPPGSDFRKEYQSARAFAGVNEAMSNLGGKSVLHQFTCILVMLLVCHS